MSFKRILYYYNEFSLLFLLSFVLLFSYRVGLPDDIRLRLLRKSFVDRPTGRTCLNACVLYGIFKRSLVVLVVKSNGGVIIPLELLFVMKKVGRT